ncbi:hypothetical protein FSW04_04510 [Baekduia soli]|uniref:Uncharacterized protein n=1 Tax=Baekduia soli TaxID=496014 RepID=A0A5B8U1N7_9ACTN|nr:hypothetical protein [Baekduia soli]QEC46923.1 hypothetical protein FSW04_04510 [Baekduia soli]
MGTVVSWRVVARGPASVEELGRLDRARIDHLASYAGGAPVPEGFVAAPPAHALLVWAADAEDAIARVERALGAASAWVVDRAIAPVRLPAPSPADETP